MRVLGLSFPSFGDFRSLVSCLEASKRRASSAQGSALRQDADPMFIHEPES